MQTPFRTKDGEVVQVDRVPLDASARRAWSHSLARRCERALWEWRSPRERIWHWLRVWLWGVSRETANLQACGADDISRLAAGRAADRLRMKAAELEALRAELVAYAAACPKPNRFRSSRKKVALTIRPPE